jgi:CheY-like chemotaxis protein
VEFALERQCRLRGIDIPVIILTAFDSNEARQQAKKAGAAVYFRKPVDEENELRAVLEKT